MSEEVFDGYRKKSDLDNSIESLIQEHIVHHNILPMDILKNFPILIRRHWLKRFLAHVELFRLTLEIPGDIAELGVFRGLGLMTWANLLEVYCIGKRSKIVYGFDNWEGFTELSSQDGLPNEDAHKIIGDFNPSHFYNELQDAISIFDQDRFIPGKARIKLQRGQIEKSIPRFLEVNPGIRFSLVHFDCDLYCPTKAALESLWPRISRGGILLFDEYAIEDWPGETLAVDEFIADKQDLKLKTFSWTNTPGAYLIKP